MKFRPTTVCVVPSLLATGLTPGAATTDVISATGGGGVIQKSLALHPRASVVRKRRAFFDFYRSTCRYNQLEAAMGKASTMKRWAAACRMGILLLIWAWGSAGALTISNTGTNQMSPATIEEGTLALNGGMRYLKSPRHAFYVQFESYLKELDRARIRVERAAN